MPDDSTVLTVPHSSDNFVLLLGAGFSTALGPPVMRAFMGKARRNYHRLKTSGEPALRHHYQRTLDFQQECMRQSGWLFNRDWENIEEVYTQADLRRLAAGTDNQEAEDLCASIAWTIWDVYRRCEHLGQHVDFPTHLQNFLSTIREGDGLRPVVITTNYDCLVELCFLEHKWRWWYPGLQSPRTGNLLREAPGEEAPSSLYDFPLVKIHGSSNWFCLGGKCVARPPVQEPDLVMDRLAKDIRTGLSDSPPTARIAPTIIPPMLGKATLQDIIARQWREAIRLLSGARKLWIIGYSFPPTDAFMPRLLAEGMQENEDLDEVIILNRENKSSWLDRVAKLFTPSLRQKVGYMARETSTYLADYRTTRASTADGRDVSWF